MVEALLLDHPFPWQQQTRWEAFNLGIDGKGFPVTSSAREEMREDVNGYTPIFPEVSVIAVQGDDITTRQMRARQTPLPAQIQTWH